MPRIGWNPAEIWWRLQKLLGHAKLEDTVKYLHLSRRHLQSVANPLDSLTVNRTAQEMKRSRLKKKR